MIDLAAARAKLADIATQALPVGVTVYPTAVETTAALPAVIIGNPSWDAEDQPCMDRLSVPVAVVVARPGTQDIYAITQLEGLWPVLVTAFQDALMEDETLGGVVKNGDVVRAGYVPFTLQSQGTDYPAQVITVDLYG